MGDLTDIVQLGTGHHVSAGEGRVAAYLVVVDLEVDKFPFKITGIPEQLPAPWQDILDLAYYSGWRKNEILGLTWDELDEAGGVIRLSPARSKTWVGRILPISPPIADVLARRRARRDPTSPLVFHHDGIPVRCWRTTSVETWQTWPMNSASTWQ